MDSFPAGAGEGGAVVTVRVLLADDHSLVRAGLRALVQRVSGFDVVAEAGDGREAVQLVEQHHPDVVLMDVMMPELDGLSAAAQVVKSSPHTRVIILSMNSGEEYVLQAMRVGAAGYVLKNASPAEFEMALRAVSRGETYLSSAVSKHVIAGYVNRVGTEGSPLDRLTPRQREVLQLIAEGNTTKDIARKLHISLKTAETHRAQMMQELDIHDVAGLVRYAIRVGLVSPN
jgi:DNA-binding NarL/FixJ family response regulator